MKKLWRFAVITAIFGLAACGEENYDEVDIVEAGQEYLYLVVNGDESEVENKEDNEEVEAAVVEGPQFIPTPFSVEAAAYYLERLNAIWDADDGEMWGMPLHAPVIIACAETLIAVANRPDAEGKFERQYVGGFAVYVGAAPPQWMIRGYHYRRWGEQEGVVATWQFLQSDAYRVPRGSIAVLAPINHTIFHVFQRSNLMPRGAAPISSNSQMSISYMMEMNALIEAIMTEGQARLDATRDAISIRHARREAFVVAVQEDLNKIGEGTAVYTELHLGLDRDEITAIIRLWPERFMEVAINWGHNTAAIEFGYLGGALWGMLLDDFEVVWRPYVNQYTNLGLILQEALGIEIVPLDEIDLEKYGYSDIVARLEP